MDNSKYYFFASADTVEIGRDPEMADVSNPNGTIYGFQSYVVAEDESGRRKAKPVLRDFSEQVATDKANEVALSLTSRFENLKKLPVDFDSWLDFGARYGSDSHCEEDLMDEEELEHKRTVRFGM